MLYHGEGGQEKRKDRKTRKSSEEKVVGFSLASLFPTSEKMSPRVEPFKQGDRPPDVEENPGSQEKRKDRKSQISKNEKKVAGFSSASLFPARKRKAFIQGRTRGIDHLTWRKAQGAGTSKTGRTSETSGAFQIHSHKTRITRVRAL